jgi:hypothetical protein
MAGTVRRGWRPALNDGLQPTHLTCQKNAYLAAQPVAIIVDVASLLAAGASSSSFDFLLADHTLSLFLVPTGFHGPIRLLHPAWRPATLVGCHDCKQQCQCVCLSRGLWLVKELEATWTEFGLGDPPSCRHPLAHYRSLACNTIPPHHIPGAAKCSTHISSQMCYGKYVAR